MKYILVLFMLCCFVMQVFAVNKASNSIQDEIVTLKAFVDDGLKHINEVGIDKACKDFNDPNGKFMKGDKYLFVFNFNGKVLANGGDATVIGKNLFNAKDKFGTPYFQLFVEAANRGGGVVSYYWTKPTTKSVHYKTSYIKAINDMSFIGSGIYKSLELRQSQETKINELKKFVNSGIDYFKQNGADVAYKEFNNQQGKFVKKDWYLFVVNNTGTVLAHGGDPKKMVGTNIKDLKDEFGTPLLLMFSEAAKSGGGLVSYYWHHYSEKENIIRFKISYINKLDNISFIGAGYYEN